MAPQLATGGGGAALVGGGGGAVHEGLVGGTGGQKLQAGGLTGAVQVHPVAFGAPQLLWKASMSLQPQKPRPSRAWWVRAHFVLVQAYSWRALNKSLERLTQAMHC